MTQQTCARCGKNWRDEYPHIAKLVDRFWYFAGTMTLVTIATILCVSAEKMFGISARPWSMYINGLIVGARHFGVSHPRPTPEAERAVAAA